MAAVFELVRPRVVSVPLLRLSSHRRRLRRDRDRVALRANLR